MQSLHTIFEPKHHMQLRSQAGTQCFQFIFGWSLARPEGNNVQCDSKETVHLWVERQHFCCKSTHPTLKQAVAEESATVHFFMRLNLSAFNFQLSDVLISLWLPKLTFKLALLLHLSLLGRQISFRLLTCLSSISPQLTNIFLVCYWMELNTGQQHWIQTKPNLSVTAEDFVHQSSDPDL